MGKTIWFIGLFPLKPVKKQYQLGSRVAFLEICVNGFALKICSVLYDSRGRCCLIALVYRPLSGETLHHFKAKSK